MMRSLYSSALRRSVWRTAALAAALCALHAAPHEAAAQQRIVVFPEPGTPVIATEVLVATGPADEAPGQDGISHLAARAVVAPIRPALDSLDAHLAVTAHKDAVGFTLTAAPDTWEAATQLLLVALFRDPVDSLAFARERDAVVAQLRARQVNPADAAARAADSAFFGVDHPWSRPEIGTPETVARLTAAQAGTFLRTHFAPERAVAVVVGPADPERARTHLASFLGEGGPVRMDPLRPRPAQEPVRRDYNAITTWVSASYPFPVNADVEALRLFAHLVSDALAFGPTRRSVFDVKSEVVRRAGGGEMRITVVIPPEEAGAWADRIQTVVRDVAEQQALRDVWAMRIRKYRGERLQGLLSPEQRAREAARRLLVLGQANTVVPDLDALSVNRVRAAAISLGEPALVFLGPFLDED